MCSKVDKLVIMVYLFLNSHLTAKVVTLFSKMKKGLICTYNMQPIMYLVKSYITVMIANPMDKQCVEHIHFNYPTEFTVSFQQRTYKFSNLLIKI